MDIALTFAVGSLRADWSVANGDLAKGADLATAIAVCLFTDRRASDDYVPPAPVDPDQRGWWGDTFTGRQVGSRLWQRARSFKTDTLFKTIKLDCQEALQPLVDFGTVASFDINAQWKNRTMIVIAVTAHMPSGAPQTFPFSWAWNQVG